MRNNRVGVKTPPLKHNFNSLDPKKSGLFLFIHQCFMLFAEIVNCSYSNIVYRLNSDRESYIANGGKLGRKKGGVKTTEQKKEEYKEVISFLKRGYSVRNTATLSNVSVSTVQRVKREFCLQQI